jgi:mannose-1-phosphate guanylyltransferase
MIIPVVIAGGSGTRLWPLSRKLYPKQFIPLIDNTTMLQNTISMVNGLACKPPIIVCNQAHRFIVAEQLRQQCIEPDAIILEPISRNTAPAIALAALHAVNNTDDLLLVLPADHIIKNADKFCKIIQSVTKYAKQGKLITFGIVPNKAETGYGYIKQGKKVANNIFNIESFIEKPNLTLAKKFLASGEYLWNSGIFLMQASSYLAELAKYQPDILACCTQAMRGAYTDLDFLRLDVTAFCKCPQNSIDYAVMEHTNNALVAPMNLSWQDIGSWSSIWEISDKDKTNNAVCGKVLLEDTNNSYIYAQNKLIATVGVDNMVIIETTDAILVMHKDKDQQVKNIVNKLQNNKENSYLQHQKTYQPWGNHYSLVKGEGFQVRLLTLKPHEKTATQCNQKLAKNLLVVTGTAIIHLDNNKTIYLQTNKSIHIPANTANAIENYEATPLKIIEIFCGDDIELQDTIRLKEYEHVKQPTTDLL